MNNYSSPLIIRIVNKLDFLVGSIALCGMIYDIMVLGENFEPLSKQAAFIEIVLILYSLVCITKVISYIACIFQCYRVSVIGLTLYVIWTILVVLVTCFMVMVTIASYIRI